MSLVTVSTQSPVVLNTIFMVKDNKNNDVKDYQECHIISLLQPGNI